MSTCTSVKLPYEEQETKMCAYVWRRGGAVSQRRTQKYGPGSLKVICKDQQTSTQASGSGLGPVGISIGFS